MRSHAAALALILAGALPAQTLLVDPPEFEFREGVGSFRYTAGNMNTALSMRCWQFQQIHDNLALKGPINIKAMAFRRDAGASFHWDGWKIETEMILSTCPLTSQTYSTIYANNTGLDATTVIARKWISLPPVPRTIAMPEPFLVKLMFDPGKTFTLAQGKSLAWHWKGWDNDLHLNSVDHHYLDYEYPSVWSPTKAMPGGCFSMGWAYFRPQYCTTECEYDAALDKYAIHGYTDHAPFHGTAFHAVGLPLNPPGTFVPVGGPDFFGSPCRLFLNPGAMVVSAPYLLDARGYGIVTKAAPFFYLPNDPNFYGVTFWSQSFTVDSNLIVYTSNVDMFQPHYRYAPNKVMGVSVIEVAEYDRVNQAWSTYGGLNRAMPVQFTL